jgi:hypothetical protein
MYTSWRFEPLHPGSTAIEGNNPDCLFRFGKRPVWNRLPFLLRNDSAFQRQRIGEFNFSLLGQLVVPVKKLLKCLNRRIASYSLFQAGKKTERLSSR